MICDFLHIFMTFQVLDPFRVDNDRGKFCGSNIPPTIQSSSFALDVYFTSDATITRPGFNVTVYFIERGVLIFFQKTGC